MGYISELRKYVGHSPIMATSVMCIKYDRGKGILFGKSADFGVWCVPGGALEIGESLEKGLKREVKEEIIEKFVASQKNAMLEGGGE